MEGREEMSPREPGVGEQPGPTARWVPVWLGCCLQSIWSILSLSCHPQSISDLQKAKQDARRNPSGQKASEHNHEVRMGGSPPAAPIGANTALLFLCVVYWISSLDPVSYFPSSTGKIPAPLMHPALFRLFLKPKKYFLGVILAPLQHPGMWCSIDIALGENVEKQAKGWR